MASNTQELLSKLKRSLPKVEAAAAPGPVLARISSSISLAATKSPRAPKLSVSLYQHDIDRLERIKDFMKAQGFRNLSDSEALRLACRRVEIDSALVETYRAMQGEDGRRR